MRFLCAPRRAGVFLNISAKFWRISGISRPNGWLPHRPRRARGATRSSRAYRTSTSSTACHASRRRCRGAAQRPGAPRPARVSEAGRVDAAGCLARQGRAARPRSRRPRGVGGAKRSGAPRPRIRAVRGASTERDAPAPRVRGAAPSAARPQSRGCADRPRARARAPSGRIPPQIKTPDGARAFESVTHGAVDVYRIALAARAATPTFSCDRPRLFVWYSTTIVATRSSDGNEHVRRVTAGSYAFDDRRFHGKLENAGDAALEALVLVWAAVAPY